jgi:hypothetical protein
MRPEDLSALPRPPFEGRRRALLALTMLGLISGGCARERHEITPTTLGTDSTKRPRGKMTPFPWPGQDIVKADPRPGQVDGPTVDPNASMASGERPIR